jgi:REP element-mobilizing transposase RayT
VRRSVATCLAHSLLATYHMPRPLRMLIPGSTYFVTNRTFQGRLLMTPSPRVNGLIGGVIAKALTLYDVAIHDLHFASNHFHMLATPAGHQLSAFLAYIESNIAKEVGREIGWHGAFWHRRFSAEPVLDDEALISRRRYLGAHGVKEGLVDQSEDWPGLTSLPETTRGEQRTFPWYDRSAQYWARRRGESDDENRFVTMLPLTITPLPCDAHLEPSEQQRRARAVLDEAQRWAWEKRDGRPSLGPEAVMRQDPEAKPKRSKWSARPMCHASSRRVIEEFRRAYREFVAIFAEASEPFRRGDISVVFPDYSFRPPLPAGWSALGPPVPA